jgi:LPS sulfotransferase NodH
MIKISKTPVVILANYRSGSTALCRAIANENNILGFSEPSRNPDRCKAFIECYNNNKNYVIKFMPDQFKEFKLYKKILSRDCYKILLTRQNKLDQITSLYIAAMRNVWGRNNKTIQEEYTLSINKKIIDNSIKKILSVDSMLENYREKSDIVLTYEDLGIIKNIDLIKTDQPKNLEEIKEKIKKRMETIK